jgi:DNA processing protein
MEESDTSRDLVSWLILMRSPGLFPVTINKLLFHFGTPTQLVKADSGALGEAGLKLKTIDYFRRPDWKKIETDLAWLSKPGNTFVSFMDNQFPLLLRNIPDPPIGLFVCGSPDVLSRTQIAVIGTRKPTPGGKRIATEFARLLGNYGLTITSGLAVGIDTAAHEGALLSDNPTIAVLANGLDMVYPRSNRQLAEKICQHGAIVSEFPINTKPIPRHFPRRNRIISGLSVGTLVVEAATRSGSLITAGLASEQGREVFAVPGSICNPVTAGCHALISNGAKLTTNIGHILEEIGPLCALVQECEPGLEKPESSNERLDEAHKLLLDNIGYEPVTIDQLVEVTGIPVQVVGVLLLDLELNGLIDAIAGGRFSKI